MAANTFRICLGLVLLLALPAGASAQLGDLLGVSPAEATQCSTISADNKPAPPTESTTTIHCWNGETRTCYGTTSYGTDSRCSSNQRGYCYGSATGYQYCPVCPLPPQCQVIAYCASGANRTCTGSCSDSFAIDNCYAYCDGTYYWCSNPPLCPI